MSSTPTATRQGEALTLAYLGNFGAAAPHSTENHVAQAFEANGHTVLRHQENEVDWAQLAAQVSDVDFLLWTHTEGFAGPPTYEAQRRFLDAVTVPTAVIHLDLWHSLSRAHLVNESPHFRCDLVCTADGGHDEEWAKAGVNHRWLPPGVSEFECEPGTPRDEYRAPVTFVGSWRPGYHPESTHRAQLVRHLQRRRQRDVKFWPKLGEHAVRGEALRDLYASTMIVVGDSCLVGTGLTRYVSDRVPETCGRGGFLLHPHVDGITDGGMYSDGEHLRTWSAGDWRALDDLIAHYLAHPDEAAAIAEKGRAHTLANHTYTIRARQLVDLMVAEGLL